MNETQGMQQILFDGFIEFLHSQKQLQTAKDLNPELLYEWIHSPDGVHTGRVILSVGVPLLDELLGKKYDAQINVEVDVFDRVDVPKGTHVKIWKHKEGPLTSGWKEKKGEERRKRRGEQGGGDAGVFQGRKEKKA